MKKFYIPTLLAVFFLSSFYSQGQTTYTSITSNPTNLTFDDPNFWLGGTGAPPNPCTNCTIIIQSNVSMVQPGFSSSNPPNITIFQTMAPLPPGDTAVRYNNVLTVGTIFQSSVDGYIYGTRFYKVPGMGGTHIGAIYRGTPTQTLIDSVIYTNETASGWQTANFTSPLKISANVTYVMATYMSDSNFVAENNYFDHTIGSHPNGVSNGPLTALAANEVPFGGNSVYNGTGTGLQFPGTTPNGIYFTPNLWVDINFNTVNLDSVAFNNSTIKIIGNTTVNINTYVTLSGSTIVVGNDPTTPVTLFVNDQLDIDASSGIQIGNSFSRIDANNGAGNSVIGPHADFTDIGGPNLAGIYSIFTPPTMVGGFPYSYTLNLEGIGTAAGSPGTFISQYAINCPPGSPPTGGCLPGIIYGPAITGVDANLGVIFGTTTTLPVQLVQFIATKNDDGSVKVSWATSQEQNSDFYDVERSGDQADWSSIGTVKAKGFSSTTSNYFLTDKTPLSGTGYYRLKMVDLDGKYKYSPTVTVSTDKNSVPLVIYSNPFFDQIRLKINLSRPQNLMMTVSDMQGKTYITQSYQAQSGDNFVNIQPSVSSSGMYILRIQGETYSQTVKLEKQ